MAEDTDPSSSDDQKLGLDASGMERVINGTVIPMLKELNKEAGKVAKQFAQASEDISATSQKFTRFDELGNKYIVHVDKIIEDEKTRWEGSAKLIQLSEEAFAALNLTALQHAKVLEDIRGKQESLIATTEQQIRLADELNKVRAAATLQDRPSFNVSGSEPGAKTQYTVDDSIQRQQAAYAQQLIDAENARVATAQHYAAQEQSINSILAGRIQAERELDSGLEYRRRLAQEIREQEAGEIAEEARRNAVLQKQKELADQILRDEIQRRGIQAAIEARKDTLAQEANNAARLKAELTDARVQSDIAAEAAKKRAAEEKQTTEELAKQKAFLKQLTDQEDARQAATRREAANRVGQRLISGVPDGLDPNTLAQVNVAIGQITNAINKNAITAEDALKTISAVEKGEAAAFEGAASRVANATRRIQTLIASGGFTPPGGGNWGGSGGGSSTPPPSYIDNIIQQNNKLIQSFKETEDQAQKTAFRIGLSWEQLWKLFLIQALHTLVRKFFESLKETIVTTEQLQIKISEIQTISQDAQQSTDQWASSLRQLSNEFGAPVLDVAAGLYETISNQIAHGAEATNFMREAMEFSKVTVSSTKDSVNLLSSALNSFHLNTDQTRHSAEILFETIVLGRVRAEEMANSFGRLGSLAAPLGIHLDELGASIATLTRQGVKYDEVQTLLSNVMIRLIKPSDEMKQIFKEWGVASGEAAINTYGFFGVMEKLSKISGGSLSEIADQFKNIRAIVGDAAFLNNFENVKQDLEDIRSKAKEEYAKGIQLTQLTDAQELVRQGQQIKNFFSETFGQESIRYIVQISRALSDEGLLGVVKSLIRAGEVGAAAATVYFGALKAVPAILGTTTAVLEAKATVETAEAIRQKYLLEALGERTVAERLLAGQITADTEATSRRIVALEELAAAEAQVTAAKNAALAATAELIAAEEAEVISENQLIAVKARAAESIVALDTARAAEIEATEVAAMATRDEALANGQAAAAHMANAESLTAQAAAQEVVTAKQLAFNKSMYALGARIGGLLSNPVIITTAVVTALGFALKEMYDAESKAEEMFKKAREAGQQEADKLTRALQDELAQRARDFEDSLQEEYRIYGRFASGINKILDRMEDYYKDQLKESVDATKESLKVTLQQYEEMGRKIQETYKRTIDAIRKLKEDEEKSNQEFADKQFQNELKKAQHADEMAEAGKGAKGPVDQNQIDLINKREADLKAKIAQLQADSAQTAASMSAVGTSQYDQAAKHLDDNKNLTEKYFKEIEQLHQNSFDRRLRIEKEAKSTQDQLNEALAKKAKDLAVQAAEDRKQQAEDAGKAEGREFSESINRQRTHKNSSLEIMREGHREEQNLSRDQRTSANREEQAARRLEQNREADKRIAELQAKLASEQASLNLLPKFDGFDAQAVGLQQQKIDALKKEEEIRERLAVSARKQNELHEQNLQAMKVAVDMVEKFKTATDSKDKIEKPEDLEKRLTKFTNLANDALAKAVKAGVDPKAIADMESKFRKEWEAIRKSGTVDLEKEESRRLEQQILNNEKAVKKEADDRRKIMESGAQETKRQSQEIFGIVGTGTAENKEGALGELSNIWSWKSATVGTQTKVENLRIQISEATKALLAQENDFITKGTKINTDTVSQYALGVLELKKILEGQNRLGEVSRTETDEYGHSVDIHYADEIHTLETFINQFIERIKRESTSVEEGKAHEQALVDAHNDLAARQQALNKKFGFDLPDETTKAAKGMHDLTGELIELLKSFDNLKDRIDHMQPPAPAAAHAMGGYISGEGGVDKIPAWLSNGEYVMNAESTSRYRPILDQMNFRPTLTPSLPKIQNINSVAQGDSYSFGDWHFHGSDASQMDARQFAHELQGMIRRGEVTLRQGDSTFG